MLKFAVYITSDDRSGSTLLDLLLGNHSMVTSVGELHHLTAYTNKDRFLYSPVHPLTCLCSKDVKKCGFWKKVERELQFPLEDIELRLLHARGIRSRKDIYGKRCTLYFLLIFRYIMRNVFPISNLKFIQKVSGYELITENYIKLYKAISLVDGTTHVVDSSKSPHRFRHLYCADNNILKILVLYRNPTGVVYSNIKRGMKLCKAVRNWNRTQKKILRFLRGINEKNYIIVNYDALCTDPDLEISKICRFLELPFEKNMTILQKHGNHHIGGSPSKFLKNNTEIKIDNEFDKKLSSKEIALIRKKTAIVENRFINMRLLN